LLLNHLTPTKIKMATRKTGIGCPVEVLSPGCGAVSLHPFYAFMM